MSNGKVSARPEIIAATLLIVFVLVIYGFLWWTAAFDTPLRDDGGANLESAIPAIVSVA